MIDWFVLFTPLLLLPIVLLLAFIGCAQILGVGDFHSGVHHILFGRGANFASINDIFEITLDWSGISVTPSHVAIHKPVLAIGSNWPMTIGQIGLHEAGTLKCQCEVIKEPGKGKHWTDEISWDKSEGEGIPTLLLVESAHDDIPPEKVVAKSGSDGEYILYLVKWD